MASPVNQHCANCIGTLSSELHVVGTNPFLFWGHLVLCCLLNCQLPTVKMASSFITVCSHCCSGANSVSTLDSIRKPFNNNTHTHTDHQSWMDVNVQTCSKSMLSCADVLMAIHAQTTELSSDIWISVTTRPHLWPSSPAQFSQFSIGRIVYSLSTPSCSEGWSSLVFWSKGPNFWFNWKQLVKLLATNFLVNFCPSLVTSNKQFNTFKVQVF